MSSGDPSCLRVLGDDTTVTTILGNVTIHEENEHVLSHYPLMILMYKTIQCCPLLKIHVISTPLLDGTRKNCARTLAPRSSVRSLPQCPSWQPENREVVAEIRCTKVLNG